jgi:hypothetical protein
MSKFIEIADALVNLEEIRAIEMMETTQTIICTTGEITELKNPVVRITFKDGTIIEKYGGTKKTARILKKTYKDIRKYLLEIGR